MAGIFGGSSTKPVKYTEINIQTSTQGLPIPIVWGQTRAGANILWYGNFQARPAKNAGGKGGGGKGGGSYQYSAALILGICEGGASGIAGIATVWAGQNANTLSYYGLGLFTGAVGQSGWSYLASAFPGQYLNYSGTAYVANSNYNLGSSPDLPSHNFEVQGLLYNTAPYGSMVDCNPADVLNDYLTNPYYGAQFPSANIDNGGGGTTITGGSFEAWKQYCQCFNLFISPYLYQSEQSTQIIDRWAQITNTWIFWSGNLLKAVPLGTDANTNNGVTYTPNVTPIYDLTYNDFIFEGKGSDTGPVEVTRIDPLDGYNQVELDIRDRANAYNTTSITWKDQNSVDLYGQLQSNVISAPEICDASIATYICSLIGKRSVYIRNTYKFTVGYHFVLLEPGDIITIEDPNVGLYQFAVRIQSIDEDEHQNLTIVAEEFPLGIGGVTPYPGSVATYNPPYNPNVAPGNCNPPGIIEPDSASTGGTPQVWVGVSGGVEWGGCNVYVSFDGGTNYLQIGQVAGNGVQGVLTASLPATADPDTTDTLSVNLTESDGTLPVNVEHADADAFRTLVLVDQELIAFGAATLISANTYNLTYLRRGLYGTVVASHASGAQFTLLAAQNIFTYDLPQAYVGDTLNFKFQGYNVFGNNYEQLSSCTAYSYTTTGLGYYIAPPTSPSLSIVRTVQSDGTTLIGLDLAWTASAGPLLGSYEVQVSSNSGSIWSASVTVGAGATSYTFSPGVVGTTYEMRVRAISTTGINVSTWATSSAVNVATLNAAAPPTVTGVTATAVGSNVQVQWTPSAPTTLTYQVWRMPGTAAFNGSTGTFVGQDGVNGSSFLDITSAANTQYTYYIIPVNGTTYGAVSAGATITTGTPVSNVVYQQGTVGTSAGTIEIGQYTSGSMSGNILTIGGTYTSKEVTQAVAVSNRAEGANQEVSGSTVTLMTTAMRITIGAQGARTLQFGWKNSQLIPGGEQNNPNPVTLAKVSVTLPGNTTTTPLTFNGGRAYRFAPGEEAWTDPLPVNLAAGAVIWLQQLHEVDKAGQTWGYTNANPSSVLNGTHEGYSLSDVCDTYQPSLTQPGGYPWVPFAVVGVPLTTPPAVVAVLGTSVSAGEGDYSADTGSYAGQDSVGYACRMLSNLGIPAVRLAVGAGTIYTDLLNTNLIAECIIKTGCNFFVTDAGYNDTGAGVVTTLAGMQTLMQEWWNFLQSLGLKGIQCTFNPRSTSTDGWVTTANQTGNDPNGLLVATNNWLRGYISNPSSLHPALVGIFDLNQYFAAGLGSNQLIWQPLATSTLDPATGVTSKAPTPDGYHPNANVVIVAATGLSVLMTNILAAANYTPPGQTLIYQGSTLEGYVGTLVAGSGLTVTTTNDIATFSSAGGLLYNTGGTNYPIGTLEVTNGVTGVVSGSILTLGGLQFENAGIPVGGTTVTWNPSYVGGSSTLSGGNLTFNGSNSGSYNWTTTLAQAAATTATKYYWEITTGTQSGTSTMIGMANHSEGMGGWPGESDANGIGFEGSGSVWYNGNGSYETGYSFGASTTVGVAVDLIAGKIWFNIGGTWSGSPSAGTGGSTMPVTGTVFPAVAVQGTGSTATANFGASTFVNAVPAGFTSWGSSSSVNISTLNFSTNLSASLAGSVLTVTATGGSSLVLENQGTIITPGTLNFGGGTTITTSGSIATLSVGGGGSSLTIEANGTVQTTGTLNFAGGTTLSTSGGVSTVTVGSGGGGGGTTYPLLVIGQNHVPAYPGGRSAKKVSSAVDLCTTTTAGGNSTGKFYWEITRSAYQGANAALVGIGSSNTDLNYASSVINAVALYGSTGGTPQFFTPNNTSTGVSGMPSIDSNCNISIAVDFGAQLIWMRVNGGNWNGSGTANPATGTGGESFSSLTGPFWPVFYFYYASEIFSVNFGQRAYSYTAPSSFNNLTA